MKFKSLAYLASAVVLSGSLLSCTHDFEEINTDPNKMNVGDLHPYGMFEQLFYSTASNQTYYTYYWNDELVQFTACTGLSGQERHRYKITDTNWKSIWSNYATKAVNAVHMYNLGVKYEEKACQAVALTLKVYLMSNLTDIFGDIPYSEAFKGDEGLDRPKFDSQKDVYDQMFADLEEANSLYAEKPTFEKATMDIMYGGDMTLWRKFNNSLYLRLLCRVAGRPESGATDKIREIVNDTKNYPVMTSNTESAIVKNTGVDPYYNYFRPIELDKTKFSKNTYKVTEEFLKLTLYYGENDTEQDPRLTTWCTKYSNGEDWKGTVAGCRPEDAQMLTANCAYLNYEVLVRDDAPVFIMDYSEVQFILAEAAQKGWIDGGEQAARTYYENAVKASCQKWAEYEIFSLVTAPINTTNINKFLTSHLAGWDNNPDKEKLIAEQKFLSLFWVGMEAYHEIRRTSYPRLVIGPGCLYNNFEFPQRMGYPTTTVGSNPDNVNEALIRMGGENDMRTPVWWSYKAINGNFPSDN